MCLVERRTGAEQGTVTVAPLSSSVTDRRDSRPPLFFRHPRPSLVSDFRPFASSSSHTHHVLLSPASPRGAAATPKCGTERRPLSRALDELRRRLGTLALVQDSTQEGRCRRCARIAILQDSYCAWRPKEELWNPGSLADEQEVHTAFRTGGLDPDKNPRLAKALVAAKEAGVPKANIEGAFARVSNPEDTGFGGRSMSAFCLQCWSPRS